MAADPGLFTAGRISGTGNRKTRNISFRFSINNRADNRFGKSYPPASGGRGSAPLVFRKSSSGDHSEGQFVFQLIKRSSRVSQPGDLSCPGGHAPPHYGPTAAAPADPRPFSHPSRPGAHICITTGTGDPPDHDPFSGECPARILGRDRAFSLPRPFLGPLPTYSLTLFRRTIFPLAGFVENPGSYARIARWKRSWKYPWPPFTGKNLSAATPSLHPTRQTRESEIPSIPVSDPP